MASAEEVPAPLDSGTPVPGPAICAEGQTHAGRALVTVAAVALLKTDGCAQWSTFSGGALGAVGGRREGAVTAPQSAVTFAAGSTRCCRLGGRLRRYRWRSERSLLGRCTFAQVPDVDRGRTYY